MNVAMKTLKKSNRKWFNRMLINQAVYHVEMRNWLLVLFFLGYDDVLLFSVSL